MATIRFYYHPRSPYSRLGVHMMAKRKIQCRTIIFSGPPEGNEFLDPTRSPAKFAYMREDIPRMTRKLGLPLTMPANLNIDFEPVMRAALAADLAGFGLAFAHAVSEARWGDGLDLSDLSILRACADEAGWNDYDPDSWGAEIDTTFQEHRAFIEEDQVFGVPFVTCDGKKFWGHDRMQLFLEECAQG